MRSGHFVRGVAVAAAPLPRDQAGHRRRESRPQPRPHALALGHAAGRAWARGLRRGRLRHSERRQRRSPRGPLRVPVLQLQTGPLLLVSDHVDSLPRCDGFY